MIIPTLAVASLIVWIYLFVGRGFFWIGAGTCEADGPDDERHRDRGWPRVIAVVPARDEAGLVGRALGALLEQDYEGPFAVVLVDDQSSDGTADAALAAAGSDERLTIVRGRAPPAGWAGKVWAMAQGVAAADAAFEAADFLLFVDADIVLGRASLRRLTALASERRAVLASLMVKLRCESPAERWLVPAFVFLFQMLYPFAWAADPRRRTAAAAGGCMLAHRESLSRAGGLAALRGALIDDCALAALMKRQGPIWLGLTRDSKSLRSYPTFGDFARMVARSAFAELRFSALRLAVVLAAMGVVFLAPPLLAIFARGAPQALGAAAWAIMAALFVPTLRLYGRTALTGLALPPIAAAYMLFTMQSAAEFWAGRGGLWKGRVQARPTRAKGV